MATIESFSTAGLDPRRKLAFWNDCASESFSPLVSEPEDIRGFNGSIMRGSIGDMSLAEVYSDAQIVRHSRSHVARTKDAMFFLHLQLEGESISRQDGRESLLHAGDFTLCDSTRRYEMVFTGANRMLVLGIPNATLRRQVGCPESLAAIPMPGSRGASGLLSQLLRKYWSEYHQGLDEQTGARIAVAILDLIGAAYADSAAGAWPIGPRSDRTSDSHHQLHRGAPQRSGLDADAHRRGLQDDRTLPASSVLGSGRDRGPLHSATPPRGLFPRAASPEHNAAAR